jgi:hypothetical protein
VFWFGGRGGGAGGDVITLRRRCIADEDSRENIV